MMPQGLIDLCTLVFFMCMVIAFGILVKMLSDILIQIRRCADSMNSLKPYDKEDKPKLTFEEAFAGFTCLTFILVGILIFIIIVTLIVSLFI